MTRQVEVLVGFAKNQQLPGIAGLYAEGRVETSQSEGLALPASIIVRDGDEAFAWVVKENKLHKAPLKLGDRDPAQRRDRGARRARRGRQVAALPQHHPARRPAGAAAAGISAMFLSNFSIRQPITTVAIVIVLMCLGLLAIKNLRVNQIPDVQQPILVVQVPYPGASPETVEREVINRIEKPLQSIPQVYETARQRLRKAAPSSSSPSTTARTWSKPRTRSATPSARCATSCHWKCANRCCSARIPRWSR